MMMPTSRTPAGLFLLSFVLHVLGVLLIGLLWKDQVLETADDWLEADLLITVPSSRPALHRSRPMEIRAGATLETPDPLRISHPVETPKTRAVTAARISNRQRDFSVLGELDAEEQLAAPDTDKPQMRQAARSIVDPNARELLSGRGSVRTSLQAGSERKVARDGVGDAMMAIADALMEGNLSGKVDVVFLLDASGSMDPHIAAVARHLGGMAKKITERDVDALFGVVAFKRLDRQDIVEIAALTTDLDQLRQVMGSLRCEGDERALDVILQTLRDFELRKDAVKAFVLVTDERLTGKASLEETIAGCKGAQVRVNVLGMQDAAHDQLAKKTQGLRFPLPTDYGGTDAIPGELAPVDF